MYAPDGKAVWPLKYSSLTHAYQPLFRSISVGPRSSTQSKLGQVQTVFMWLTSFPRVVAGLAPSLKMAPHALPSALHNSVAISEGTTQEPLLYDVVIPLQLGMRAAPPPPVGRIR